MRRSRLVVLLFASVMMPAQDKLVELTGVVTNSVTGEPITRASVTLSNNDHAKLTSVNGKFSFEGLAPGSYLISVERVGFALSQDPVTLRAGTQHDAVVKLIPFGAISGRVLNEDGEPLSGVNVYAGTRLGVRSAAETDEKGNFRIESLRPGKYRLRAVHDQESLPPEKRTDRNHRSSLRLNDIRNAGSRAAGRLKLQGFSSG